MQVKLMKGTKGLLVRSVVVVALAVIMVFVCGIISSPVLTAKAADSTTLSNISCADMLQMTVGEQKVIFLRTGVFRDYRLSSDIADIRKLSSNLLNFTAKKGGRAIFTATDSNGKGYDVNVIVTDENSGFNVTNKGDYVNYSINKKVFSDVLSVDTMFRSIKMNSNTCITFSAQDNRDYEYRYSVKTEGNSYCAMTGYTKDGAFKFNPGIPGKYYIKVSVISGDRAKTASEVFVLTVYGNTYTDGFYNSYCGFTNEITVNTTRSYNIPGGVRNVFIKNSSVSYRAEGSYLYLTGKKIASNEIVIISNSGRMYNMYIKVVKQSEEPAVGSNVTISFGCTPPTVHTGETVQLPIKASDPAALKYVTCTSSNTNAATVAYENGICTIKGIGMGRSYITAKLPNGRSVTDYVYSIGDYDTYRTESAIEKGVDISCFNSNVDYKALKAQGYTFVIIRSGYGKEISQKDTRFETHIKGAKEAGLGIGIYHFSYAVNAENARKEAAVCNQIIAPYRNDIKYGVYFDYEDDSVRYAKQLGYTVDKKTVTDITVTFCEEIEKYGYVAGVYTNTYFGKTYLDMAQIKKYLFWYAAPYATSFAFDFDMWQYSFILRPYSNCNGDFDGDKVFSTVFQLLSK